MKYTREYEDALRRRLNDGGCPVLRNNGYKIRPVGLAIESIPGPTFNRIFPLFTGEPATTSTLCFATNRTIRSHFGDFRSRPHGAFQEYPSCPPRKNHLKGTRSIVSRSPDLIAKASMR